MSGQADRPQEILSLPQGGGALSGIGESFTADPQTGTAKLSIPLPLPPGRNGFGPRISLGYASGGGNGPFGLGWDVDVPVISRKTALGVPVYDDATDVFLLAGSDDLVPVGSPGPGVSRYRPRTEGSFAYIDHYVGAGGDYWKVRTKNGYTNSYAAPADAANGPAVIADPASPERIFAWKLTSTTDPFGNRIEYLYERDQIRVDGPHHWDQLYLAQIRYIDYGDRASPSFLVSVRFVYATRPDPFSNYRSGFEIRTVRRCQSIEIHSDTGTDVLARTMDLSYSDQQHGDRAPANQLSLLTSVQFTGHDGTATQTLPPLTCRYTAFSPTRRQFVPVGGGGTPIGVIAGSDHELIDLLGRGLPDVVQLGAVARYWRNAGHGQWAVPQSLSEAPAGIQLGQPGIRFADANGDGHLDLMVSDGTVSGYYPWNYAGSWDGRSFRPYVTAPSFDLSDPLVHLVDLTGDGVTDAIRSGSRLDCFFSDPDTGWDSVREVAGGALADFPDVSFADPRVTWADMTGDGLQDIVYVHDRIVQYWPNLGHGNWGQQITMASSPALPSGYDPARVLVGDIDGDGCADLVYAGPGQVTLWINRNGNSWSGPVTIDGTPRVPAGDLMRLIDLYGNGVPGMLFSATDAATPSGRPGSWYLEFTGGVKPYLISEIDNHIGAITKLTFASSTSFRLADDRELATAWQTTLPSPVQVVASTESIDQVSGSMLTTSYRYHNGYWDGVDHEFRGFGRVDQIDTQTLDLLASAAPAGPADLPRLETPRWCPPVQTSTWFHIGPVGDAVSWTELDYSGEYWPGDPARLARPAAISGFLDSLPRAAQRDAIRALRGTVLRSEMYGLDGTAIQNRPYQVTENCPGVAGLPGLTGPPADGPWPTVPQPWQLQVFYPQARAARSTQWERGSDPLTRVTFTDRYDGYGQPTLTLSVAVPRGRNYTSPDPAPSGEYLATITKTDWAQRDDSQVFIADRTARTTRYQVANDGTMSVWALHAAVLAGIADLELFGQTRTYYDGTAFTGRPLGQLGPYGAAVRTETLTFDDAMLEQAYASGSALAVPPERPPYLPLAGSNPVWTTDYPAAFRAQLPALAGLSWNPGGVDPDDHPGYFAEANRSRFDFHTGQAGAEGPPGTGVGLLQVSRDPIGNDTTIVSYEQFSLRPQETLGPTGLTSTAEYDYRVLQVSQLTSANGNISQCAYTPLGLVASVAVMGKPGQDIGDTAAAPSLSYVYDLTPFDDSSHSGPISVRTIRRVWYTTDTTVAVADRDDTRQSAEYSDGFGRVIQVRTEAADITVGGPPGGDSGLPLDPAQNGTATGHQRIPAGPPNVAVTGWVIYDNKRQVVRSYEPFYATGLGFAVPAGTELGQHQELYYDPPGRVVLTVNPDGSQTQVVYGVPGSIAAPDLSNPDIFEPTPWEAYSYDQNDNAGRTGLAGSQAYQADWNTPASTLTDALGRVIASTVRNGQSPVTDWFTTLTSYDIRDNILAISDALGRVTYQRQYDYANRCLRTDSLDAGIRRTVYDAAGGLVERRAGNGSLTLAVYDRAHRPVRNWARDASASPVTLREIMIYGESADAGLAPGAAAAANLLGLLYQNYDEAGRVTLTAADFTGNTMDKVREVIADAVVVAGATPFAVDWQPSTGTTLAAHATSILDTAASYQTTLAYNAIGQVISSLLPVSSDGARHRIAASYDRAGGVKAVALDGASFVALAVSNARGQPLLTVYGNGLMTRHAYDPVTFRLARVRTERYTPAGLDYQPADAPLEDRTYSYDLVGNILQIQDRTPGSGVKANPAAFSVSDPVLGGLLASGDALLRDFAHDPLYRLVSATGRECASIPSPRPVTDDPRCGYGSGSFGSLTQDNAASMTTLYTERYSYDPIGDLTAIAHSTTAGSWTRYFGFGAMPPQDWQTAWTAHLNAGAGWASPPDTRLTHLSNDPAVSQPVYGYDQNGNLTGITTSRHLDWTHRDRLGGYRTQAGGAAATVAAAYLYDAQGTRIKKVVQLGAITQSTVYIDGVHESFRQAGPAGTIEQNTLHIMIGGDRAATVRIGTPLPGETAPATKYVLGDQVGSAAVTVDDSGSWVNREEYSPYGETMLGSYAYKRYRYAGRERDEESGLDYSQARYYAPWQGRWISPDPLTIQSLRSDLNPYVYVRGQPLSTADPSGLDGGTCPGVALCHAPASHVADLLANSPGSEATLAQYASSLVAEQKEDPAEDPAGASRDYGEMSIQPRDARGDPWSLEQQVKDAVAQTNSLDYKLAQGEAYQAKVDAEKAAADAATHAKMTGPVEHIPVAGYVRDAIVQFQAGNYGMAALNAVGAIADIALVKTLMAAAAGGVIRAAGETALVAGEHGASTGAQTLYHYTSEAGYKGIVASGSLNASLEGAGDAAFGPGQYLTDIPPERVLQGAKSAISTEQQAQGLMSRWQLSRQLYTSPWNAPKLTHFVEIDIGGLNVLNKRLGTYLIPGTSPLNVSRRIVRGGGF